MTLAEKALGATNLVRDHIGIGSDRESAGPGEAVSPYRDADHA
jgi:hypothetical protein